MHSLNIVSKLEIPGLPLGVLLLLARSIVVGIDMV